jgi:hypothetical protein
MAIRQGNLIFSLLVSNKAPGAITKVPGALFSFAVGRTDEEVTAPKKGLISSRCTEVVASECVQSYYLTVGLRVSDEDRIASN